LKWQERLSDDEKLGTYANAFQASEGDDGAVYLDFLLYSTTEKRAVVVTRIRVDPGFLPQCHERLDEVLLDLTPPASGSLH